ncbi:Heat shock protein 75 kDa, mitochondrial-like isoform X1 [Oopsacas minuta]|uniref:non-specific serine/threonine protein kinase n=1 Tax=Oopsacas minuta TaxID=111878 RepID=A0AAV7JFW9_9METZ|nr:Heat shock protein 75 kDa, mitochondrial-like isoform X1 [Oopsacas minuta]
MAQSESASRSIWPNKKESYCIEEVVGYGGTASVQAATCIPLNKRVAIKRIDLDQCTSSIEDILKEVRMMSQCSHPNVIEYHTSFIHNQELLLVMTLMGCGSLSDTLRHLRSSGHKNGLLSEDILATVLRYVLLGLDYFHSNSQIHRDLKAGNILIGESGAIRLADFGVSSLLVNAGEARKKRPRRTFVGTPCWMAPEVMEQIDGYDAKADIWSLGITALELATGYAPYSKYPAVKIILMTLENEPPTLEMMQEIYEEDYKQFSKSFRKMVASCLVKEPEKRPTAAELLKHSFFKKARDEEFLRENLVPLAPSLSTRLKKPVRVPGASGRLCRGPEGTWEWVDESEEKNEEQKKGETDTAMNTTNNSNNIPTHPASKSQNPDQSSLNSIDTSPVNLNIRLRDSKNKLKDIKFTFNPKLDTPEKISQELVNAKLIDPRNSDTITAGISTILKDRRKEGTIRFKLDYAILPTGEPDESEMYGYAQVSIFDPTRVLSIISRHKLRYTLYNTYINNYSQIPPYIPDLLTTKRMFSTKSEASKSTNEFIAETKQLLDIVANSLYSDREVFLRELISNSSDALEKLRFLQVAGKEMEDPDIPLQITISPDGKNKLTIEDTGIGMDYGEMVEYLGTIARSSSKTFLEEMEKRGESKNADSVIGRFGVGFYSSFMVANLVEVYSKNWKTGSKCYHWSSTGVGGYNIEETTSKHANTSRGTKIILHLKDTADEFSSNTRIKSIITKYSNFVQFPIYISGKKINIQDPIWLTDPKVTKTEDNKEFYKFLTGDTLSPLFTFHFRLDMPISINAVFYVPNIPYLASTLQNREPMPKVSLYSRRVLIQDQTTQIIPYWMRFVVGVVDSEDIPLNLSREMLQNNPLLLRMKQILTSRIIRAIEGEMESNKTNYSMLFRAIGLSLREGIMHIDDKRGREEIASLLMFESSKRPEDTEITLNDYFKNMRPLQEEIFYLVSPNRAGADNSPYTEQLMEKDIEILYSYSQHEDTIMPYLNEYKGKKIISVEEYTNKNLNIVKSKSVEGKALKEYTNWFENILGKAKVKKVEISNNLKKHPSMLMIPDLTKTRQFLQNTPEIENVWEYMSATLHLNPNHDLIKKVNILRKKEPKLASLIAEQIYFNSLIAAGFVRDARFILPHLHELLEKCIEDSTKSTIITPD